MNISKQFLNALVVLEMLGTFRRHLRGERGAMSEFAHSRSPLNVIRISIDAGQAFNYRDLSILYPWTTVQPGLSKEARRPEIKLYVVGQSTYKSDLLPFLQFINCICTKSATPNRHWCYLSSKCRYRCSGQTKDFYLPLTLSWYAWQFFASSSFRSLCLLLWAMLESR